MPAIVILGAGFAGAYCAQRLEKRLKGRLSRDVVVILIDPRNYFIFYPFLIEAGTGALEPRHAVVSIRAFLHRSEFIMAEARGVDFAAREVMARVSGPEGE